MGRLAVQSTRQGAGLTSSESGLQAPYMRTELARFTAFSRIFVPTRFGQLLSKSWIRTRGDRNLFPIARFSRRCSPECHAKPQLGSCSFSRAEVLFWPALSRPMATRYFAYHVDLLGVARASYQLQAVDDATAVARARYFLKFHPTLEVWQSARCIARLTRGLIARADAPK